MFLLEFYPGGGGGGRVYSRILQSSDFSHIRSYYLEYQICNNKKNLKMELRTSKKLRQAQLKLIVCAIQPL
jgi:hypothetical protein